MDRIGGRLSLHLAGACSLHIDYDGPHIRKSNNLNSDAIWQHALADNRHSLQSGIPTIPILLGKTVAYPRPALFPPSPTPKSRPITPSPGCTCHSEGHI